MEVRIWKWNKSAVIGNSLLTRQLKNSPELYKQSLWSGCDYPFC